ncbi:MAG: hypothetical protein ACREUH_06525 [Burkholderiales bacterium]
MKTLVLLIALVGLAACSEQPQVVVHKQGKYQGKRDTPPWGEGDRDKWKQNIKARQLTQNEYGRMY